MSWEYMTCPEHGTLMERTKSWTDDDGRVHVMQRCSVDGAEIDHAEPDDNHQARLAANRSQEEA